MLLNPDCQNMKMSDTDGEVVRTTAFSVAKTLGVQDPYRRPKAQFLSRNINTIYQVCERENRFTCLDSERERVK